MSKPKIIDEQTGLTTTPPDALIPATLAGKIAHHDYNSILAMVGESHRFVDTHKRCSAWYQLRTGAMLWMVRASQRGALETLYKLSKTKVTAHQPSERTMRRYLAFAEDVFSAVGIVATKGKKKQLAEGETLDPLLQADATQLEFFNDQEPEGDDLLAKINRYLKQQDADDLLKRMASAGEEKALPPPGGGTQRAEPAADDIDARDAIEGKATASQYLASKTWLHLDEEPLEELRQVTVAAAEEMERVLMDRAGRTKKKARGVEG